jgi:hypothetical protein
MERKKVEVPPKVVRALRLANEEESDAERPVKATPEQTPLVEAPTEESNVQVIEAPFIKKEEAKKGG